MPSERLSLLITFVEAARSREGVWATFTLPANVTMPMCRSLGAALRNCRAAFLASVNLPLAFMLLLTSTARIAVRRTALVASEARVALASSGLPAAVIRTEERSGCAAPSGSE